jgi:hypothetical protein
MKTKQKRHDDLEYFKFENDFLTVVLAIAFLAIVYLLA